MTSVAFSVRDPGRADPAALWWASAAGIAAILLAPLVIADVPPLLDYPNHLARLTLLAAGPDDAVLGRIAEPRWGLIPNLAIDGLGLTLLRVLPVHVAGRVLLGTILLLNLAGVLALHRAWFGRRALWPLAGALVAYNSGFLLGFLNWQIGSGLAMLLAAAWVRWRQRHRRLALAGAMLGAVALFFCHLAAVGAFLILIASAELTGAPCRREWWRRLAVVLGIAAPPLLLTLATDLRTAPAATHWVSPTLKLAQLASPFVNYIPWLDYGAAALVYGGITLGWRRGWCRVARPAGLAVAGCALAYAPMPFDLHGTSFVDTRLALLLGWLSFAATDWTDAPRRVARAVLAIAAGLFLLRMTVLAEAWWGQRRDLAELRSAIAPVPPGASVLLRSIARPDAPAYWAAAPRHRWLSIGLRTDYHMPALLLIERRAWWQELFANPAQQPLALRPAFAELYRLGHTLPSFPRLAERPSGLARFDYVLLLQADADPTNPAPECLQPVRRVGWAALYRTVAVGSCQ